MKYKLQLLTILCVLALHSPNLYGQAANAPGQRASSPNSQITASLTQFKSSDVMKRLEAFYQLIEIGSDERDVPSAIKELLGRFPGRTSEIKTALIELLDKENSAMEAHAKEFQRTGQPLDEDRGSYHADLIAAVAALNDERAINAMLVAIDTGSLATNALVGFGRAAITPVSKKLESADPTTRLAATIVFSDMLKPGNVHLVDDAQSIKHIKEMIIKAAKDDFPFVKVEAVSGLGALIKRGHVDLIPELQRLTKDKSSAADYGGGRGGSLVSKAAKEMLDDPIIKRIKGSIPGNRDRESGGSGSKIGLLIGPIIGIIGQSRNEQANGKQQRQPDKGQENSKRQVVSAIEDFVGVWVNVDTSTDGLTRLVISRGNQPTLIIRGYIKCPRQECDLGSTEVTFTPMRVTGTLRTREIQVQLAVELAGNQLKVDALEDYSPVTPTTISSPTQRNKRYVLRRAN